MLGPCGSARASMTFISKHYGAYSTAALVVSEIASFGWGTWLRLALDGTPSFMWEKDWGDVTT